MTNCRTSWRDLRLPGDLIIQFENDGLLSLCSVRYCDDCGSDGGAHLEVTDIVLP